METIEELESLKLDLADAKRQLTEIRSSLGLGPTATEVETLNAISRMKERVITVRRKARLAGVRLR